MKKLLVVLTTSILLSGCAAPKYSGNSIKQKIANITNIEIINDSATRPGFQKSMEGWLRNNNFKYVVKPDNSSHNLEKLTLEYEGHWGWDLALYLNNAHIEAFYKGQRVGKVEFKAPNSLNGKKFGNAEERIGHMMSILFNKKTVTEANKAL